MFHCQRRQEFLFCASSLPSLEMPVSIGSVFALACVAFSDVDVFDKPSLICFFT